MYVGASLPFEAVLETGVTGLVGTIAVKVIDNDGGTPVASTTANISESGTSGIYIWNAPAAPATLGQYTIVWSSDGTFAADTISTDELVVSDVVAGALPTLPPPDDGGAGAGPCTAWTIAEDVQSCCSDDEILSSDTTRLDQAIAAASELLYEASGRQFPGLCQRTVRPCKTDSCFCGVQVISRGHLVGWAENCWGGYDCGCRPLSMVKLAGFVREITQVLIDGAVVDANLYEVRENRWLIRTDGGFWPRCQSIGLPDTEEGTFSVTYTYGRSVPVSGQMAAQQLACETFKSCSGAECDLPTGVTRITRQGITIERSFLQRDVNGIWRSGLANVDLFLNTYNPTGIPRRGVFWSPSSRARYARPA